MSWYGSKSEPPKIEVGSEFVTVTTKHSTLLARILRDETRDGSRTLTLDRLLDRYSQTYSEKLPDGERSWSSSGAFVTVLTSEEQTCSDT